MFSVVKKAFNLIKLLLKGELYLFLKRIIEKISPEGTIACHDIFILSKKLMPSESKVEFGFSPRLATEEDIPQLCIMQDKPKAYKKRLQEGERCFVVEIDGKIVNMNWFGEKSRYLVDGIEYALTLESGDIYAYDGFTKESMRRKGLHSKVYLWVFDWTQRNNKKRIITIMGKKNYPSIRLHRRLGFKVMREVVYLKFFGLRIYWIVHYPRKRFEIVTKLTKPDLFSASQGELNAS